MKILAVTFSLACLLALPGEGRPAAGLIRIFAETQGREYVDNGRPGPNVGDVNIAGLRLKDRAGDIIGFGVLTCITLGHALPGSVSQCAATYTLPRGKITCSGTRQRRDFYVLAVTGGTGIYSRAAGNLVASTFALHPRRERLLFSLES